MPLRRAPSVPSVASRAPSPVIEEDEVKELIRGSIALMLINFQTPFFDSVDELQQHVSTA